LLQTNELLFYFSSQAEFLQDVGEIIESISGIDHWWIGLSDIGEQKITNIYLHFLLMLSCKNFLLLEQRTFFLQNCRILKQNKNL
jgi:hypothetical protein